MECSRITDADPLREATLSTHSEINSSGGFFGEGIARSLIAFNVLPKAASSKLRAGGRDFHCWRIVGSRPGVFTWVETYRPSHEPPLPAVRIGPTPNNPRQPR